MTSSPYRHSSGFTLVELIITMIVISIMAAVILPRMSLLQGFDEVGYRDKVKATLEFARKAAVAQRRWSCVTLASNDLAVTIEAAIPENTTGTCAAPALALPATDKSCSPSSSNKVCHPNNVTLTGPGTLRFSPLGKPSAGSTYTVQSTSTGTSFTITVEAESGYVH